MAINNYLEFVKNPSRRDVELFDVVVKDADGVEQTLRWAREDKAYHSSPADSPADTIWEPRVLEGSLEYQSPDFDPFNPSYGVQAAPAPSPLVVKQFDAELDAKRTWRWPGATVTVRHGGYTEEGWLPLSHWKVVNTVEVDGPPRFELDRVTFPLRNRDARFDELVERRKLGALGGAIEGDGATSGVDFYPHAPGVRVRARAAAVRGDSGNNITIDVPEGTQDGDLMRLLIASHSNDDLAGTYQDWNISSAAAGWTLRRSSVAEAGGVAAHRLYLYTKVAGASEPATYTFTGSGTPCARCWEVVSWYGVDGTTPVVDDDETSPDTVDNSAPAPDVTTARVGDVLDCGWSTMNGADFPVPTGMTQLASLSKRTTTSNRSTLKSAYEVRATVGATGTRSLPIQNSRHAAVSIVIGNRAAGGAPSKLDLRNALSLQFAFIPFVVSGTQQLFGWETSPYRVFLDSSGHLNLSWKKATVTVTKTTAFTFVAGRRYHVEITVEDTAVTFYVYDWWADRSEPPEIFTGTGFHGRDTYAAGEHYTYLFNRNGGSPNQRATAQFWPVRVWAAVKSPGFLAHARMRPLTEAEEIDGDLRHYTRHDEGIGLEVGDRALQPADGVLAQTVSGPTTLSAVAAAAGVTRKFTRAAGSFVSDGWVAGRAGISSGFSSANNNGRFYVRSVAALALVIEGLELEAEVGGGNEKLESDDWRPTLTGELDQIGQQVPSFFGGPGEGWPGMPVHSSIDGVFFLVHPVAVWDIQAVQEGGGDRPISIDHTDYRAFLATLPDVGTVSTYRGDVGSFYRFRVKPELPTSCTIWGDAYDGTFVRTAADIARRVMTTRGDEPLADPGDLVTASITAVNSLCPFPVGTGVGSGETKRDFIRRVCGTCGILVWPRRDGKFDFARFDAPSGSPSKTLHRKLYDDASPKGEDPALPVSEVRARFRRNWQPLLSNQIDARVEIRHQRAFLLAEWRVTTPRRADVVEKFTRTRTIPENADEFLDLYFCDPLRAWRHAALEAERQLDLFDTVAQPLEISARQRELPTEFLEQVTVLVQDLDRDNLLRTRLGVESKTFVVTKVNDKGGLENLSVWRPDQAA